jgi:hypothetical protein
VIDSLETCLYRNHKVLSIKKISLVRFVYWFIQPLVFFVYWKYGRDTDVYVELFDSDNSYLEPLWLFLSKFLGLFPQLTPEDKAGTMVFILCLAGFLLVQTAARYRCGLTRYILILLLIFSYEISFVGGALRQGISVLFISAYLLGGATWIYILGILSHWSGSVYLLLRSRLYPVFALTALVAVYVGYSELAYMENALGRVESYVERVQDLEIYTLVALSLNKVLHVLMVIYNHKRLKLLLGMPILCGVYFAPFMQIVVLWGTKSELIFQRAGMIFDPFIIVASIVMLAKGTRYTPWVLGGLVVSKFSARLVGVLT